MEGPGMAMPHSPGESCSLTRRYYEHIVRHMTRGPEDPAWTIEDLRVELDRYEAGLGAEGKARNTITTYVYPVDRFLNWLDRPYSPIGALGPRRSPQARSGSAGAWGGRSRYDGLRTYLSERSEPVVHLSFAEIERIIGRPLPNSARRHRAWWANEQSGSHSHARSWLEATPSRRTANVDLNAQTADFVV